jgi:CRP-like cAMP-binding protein
MPRLSSLLFSAVASAVVAAEAKADALRVRNSTEQIAQFLLDIEARLSRRGEIALPMSRQQIADHFGLRLETVSRAINAMHREKKFRDREQRRVVIRYRRRLQKLALDASDFDYCSILKIRKTANTETSPARTLQ